MLIERVQPVTALESDAKYAKQYESRAQGEGDAHHDHRVARPWAGRRLSAVSLVSDRLPPYEAFQGIQTDGPMHAHAAARER